jgi:hypothetical protein
MERVLVLLQRLYWIVLAIIVGTFSLVNHDLLASKSVVDLLFTRSNVQAVWFLALVLLAFLLQILISRSLLAITRSKVGRLNQELAQLKASLSDRGEERAKELSTKQDAAPEVPGESR